MSYITVFTPTYNRAYIITKLYDSLCEQTNLNFEWVIVDDGSTDNTKDIIEDFKNTARFPILYIKKENEGKHIAINKGVELASGKWFFIVDSDDYLMPDAIDKIINHCDAIQYQNEFAGVVGLRGNKDGNAWMNWYNNKNKKSSIPDVLDCSYIEYRYKHCIEGDRAEVVKTSILKKHPFPKIENEKFLVESYLWLTLAKENYKFRWFGEVIYITEYLEDGLTQNIVSHYKKSPIGSALVANLRLSCKGIPLKTKLKSCYDYYYYGFYSKRNLMDLFINCSNKILSPFGIIMALLRK